jgi:glucokinase
MRIGVDIGGTKVAAGAVAADGAVLWRVQVPTPHTGGVHVLAAVADLVRRLMADVGAVHDGPSIEGIGVGAPGVIDPARGVVRSATEVLPGWSGTDVAGPLRAATGLPVAVENDVRVAALGESRHGAGAGVDRLLVASIGTGVGGAFVVGGELQRGNNGTAGEIAHLLVPGTGAIPCGCGRFDHLESHACGPAMAAAYRAGSGPDVAAEAPALPEVVRRWRSGDGRAGTVIIDAARLIGRALAGLAVAVDLDAVVVTGGVAGIGEDFVVPLRDALHQSSIGLIREIPVLAGMLGADAPLVGAAELVAR